MATKFVRDALRDAMREEMISDPDVFIIGEEVAEYQGAYKVTQDLHNEFGSARVWDTPITEHGFAGLAVGASFAGLKPVVEFMTFNFAMQAIDHIINSAAKTNYMSGGQIRCPIVFRGPNGAASRVGAQHSQCFASWYAHIPGLKVISPYHASDCYDLLREAIQDPNPVIFLEHELLYGVEHEMPSGDREVARIGKLKLVREGDDITIITFSSQVRNALDASEILSNQHNIEAEVLDLRTLRPLDIEGILRSIRKTNRVVIVEEGWSFAGIGAEISSRIIDDAFDYLDSPIKRISAKDVPLPYAINLEKAALPQTHDIVSVCRDMVNYKI